MLDTTLKEEEMESDPPTALVPLAGSPWSLLAPLGPRLNILLLEGHLPKIQPGQVAIAMARAFRPLSLHPPTRRPAKKAELGSWREQRM